jgi:hypothetical protein
VKYIIKDLYKRFLLLFVLTVRSEQRNEVEFKHFLCLYFLTVSHHTKFFSVTWRTGPDNLHDGFGTSFGRFFDNAFTLSGIGVSKQQDTQGCLTPITVVS